MTPGELAQRIGVNPRTVSRWLGHGRRPQPRLRVAAAQVLGYQADELWPSQLETRRGIVNEPLRRAIVASGMSEAGVADQLGVTTHTVYRWLSGRAEPRPSMRRAIAALLDRPVHQLWPQLYGAMAPSELMRQLCALYPHRAAISRDLWRQLLTEASESIDALGDFATALTTDPVLRHRLLDRSHAGVRIRLALAAGAPGADDAQRLAGGPIHLRVLRAAPATSLCRIDDDLFAAHHLPGRRVTDTPVLHTRHQQPTTAFSLASTYAHALDTTWTTAR